MKVSIAVVVLLNGFLFSEKAFAYLDPGTASLLLQGLIGGITAFFAFLGVYRRKLMARIGSFFRRAKESEGASSPEEKNGIE